MNTIVGMPQWIDKSKDTRESMNGKMRAVQIESYIHSPALFHKFTDLFHSEMGHEHTIFTELEVIDILEDDDGYAHFLHLSGKYDYTLC